MTRAGGQGPREVTLLDYGAGNVRSVRNAIHSLGYTIKDVSALDPGVHERRHPLGTVQGCSGRSRPKVDGSAGEALPRPPCLATQPPFPGSPLQVTSVKDIENASRIIFPGVGAIGQAGDSVKRMGYREALIDYIKVGGGGPGGGRRRGPARCPPRRWLRWDRWASPFPCKD